MDKHEKAFIYFDTNSLECRHSGKSLYLSQFTVNPLYYKIESIVKSMGLSDMVNICIPEVVWYELQEHLIAHFISEKESMRTKVDSFRKSFGDLVEISYEFRNCETKTEYSDYVKSIAQNFLEDPKVTASIINCPKDEKTIQYIIEQAIHCIKPFRTAKANGKEYTDAGFKDALIFYTILGHTQDQLGIFISNDNDFEKLFQENNCTNLRLCHEFEDVQTVLSTEFHIGTVNIIENRLKTDDYLCKRILTDTEFDENCAYKLIKINFYEMLDEGIRTNFDMYVNGEKHTFEIVYNVDANELIEATLEWPSEEDNYVEKNTP